MLMKTIRSYFHEVTVVRKIRTQIVCDFHSLPSRRENRDEFMTQAKEMLLFISMNIFDILYRFN